jgi:hypothetical protein
MVSGLIDRVRDAGAEAVDGARKRAKARTRPATKKAAKKAVTGARKATTRR